MARMADLIFDNEDAYAEYMEAMHYLYVLFNEVEAECAQPQYESATIVRPNGDGIPFQVEGRTLRVVNGKVSDPLKYAA